MKLLIDIQLFPCIDYLKKLIVCEHIKIEKYDFFKKMSFQNRYVISGVNNLINLTIPLAGGREQKTLLKEVLIDNSENWQIKHWRSLSSAYSKAPFFEFYSEDVKSLLFSKQEFLFSFNFNVLEWLFRILKMDAAIDFTESFINDYTDLADYRNFFLPKSFQKNTSNWRPHYAQVFQDRRGFQPNLSILDLIFCEGPNARYLLNQAGNNNKQ